MKFQKFLNLSITNIFLILGIHCISPKSKWKAPERFVPVKVLSNIWDDPIKCSESVAQGLREKKEENEIRVTTWNIKWFPDGTPGKKPQAWNPTDLNWLVCGITYLQSDVIFAQEIKLTKRGLKALDFIITELNNKTAGNWHWQGDECPDPARQHQIILYNKSIVNISNVVSDGALDPTAGEEGAQSQLPSCPGRLRPGLSAEISAGNTTFSAITVHLDSGRKLRDYSNRKKSWSLLTQKFPKSHPYLLVGDFNTMGCKEGLCESPDQKTEYKYMMEVMHANGVKDAGAGELQCSEFHKGHPQPLDYIFYSQGLGEKVLGKAFVSGLCSASKCEDVKSDYPYLWKLSDHCPISLDLKIN